MPSWTATSSRAIIPPAICPEAWAALAEANHGAEVSYGEDRWTERVCAQVREIFETDCETFLRLQRHGRQLSRARPTLPAVSRASSVTSAPTSRRMNAARRSFFPAAPNCYRRGRKRQARSRGSGRGAVPTPRCAFDQGPRAERDPGDGGWGQFIRLTNSRRLLILRPSIPSACKWMARVSPMPWPR